MKIFLVRHGQSEWQMDRSGDLDAPLSRVGHEQSRRLAQLLAASNSPVCDVRPNASCVCVSPLRRARQTASYILANLNVPLITQQSLAEAQFRVADHLPTADGPLEKPVEGPLSPPYEEFKFQVKAALRELAERAEMHGGNVLAVTHGGVISTIFRLIASCDTLGFEPYNATLNLLEWKDRRWHLKYLNFWDHLPHELRTH